MNDRGNMSKKHDNKMVRNPFPYAEIVTGPDFADRKEEIRELSRDLTSGEKILISSPRRFGKTSLIFETARRLKTKKLVFIYVDLMRATSLSRFVELYATAQARATATKVDDMAQALRRILPRLRPDITLRPDGLPEVSMRFAHLKRDIWEAFSSVLDAPEQFAQEKDVPVAVVFDEFQEVSGLGKGVVEELRSRLQFHKRCAYVFMGSKRHMLAGMFDDRSGPLFKLARPIVLTRIPRKEFSTYISGKYSKAEMPVPEKLIDEILNISEGHPYYTQLICHALYNHLLEGGSADPAGLREVVSGTIRGQSFAYLSLWDSLSVKQKALVMGLAVEGNHASIFSGDFVAAYGLTSAATVQRAVRTLENKGVIEREPEGYAIADIFFGRWVEGEIQ